MSGQLRICYHGTNQEAGEAIQKEGFRVGTYFAAHLGFFLACVVGRLIGWWMRR